MEEENVLALKNIVLCVIVEKKPCESEAGR